MVDRKSHHSRVSEGWFRNHAQYFVVTTQKVITFQFQVLRQVRRGNEMVGHYPKYQGHGPIFKGSLGRLQEETGTLPIDMEPGPHEKAHRLR